MLTRAAFVALDQVANKFVTVVILIALSVLPQSFFAATKGLDYCPIIICDDVEYRT